MRNAKPQKYQLDPKTLTPLPDCLDDLFRFHASSHPSGIHRLFRLAQRAAAARIYPQLEANVAGQLPCWQARDPTGPSTTDVHLGAAERLRDIFARLRLPRWHGWSTEQTGTAPVWWSTDSDTAKPDTNQPIGPNGRTARTASRSKERCFIANRIPISGQGHLLV